MTRPTPFPLVLALAAACATDPAPTAPVAAATPAAAAAPHETPAERGAFLVKLGGCNDCHTPMAFDPDVGMPVPDMTRALSGHPEGAPDPAAAPAGHDQAVIGPTFTSFRLPFGVVYAANLTPDPETGIGGWTEEQFVRALRTGQHQGDPTGRPIAPPMPWMSLAQQSDADLKAIFAYLQTLPPRRNAVPAPAVPPEALAGLRASYDKVLASAAKP